MIAVVIFVAVGCGDDDDAAPEPPPIDEATTFDTAPTDESNGTEGDQADDDDPGDTDGEQVADDVEVEDEGDLVAAIEQGLRQASYDFDGWSDAFEVAVPGYRGCAAQGPSMPSDHNTWRSSA